MCALKHLTRSYPCLFLLVFEVYRGIANKDITDSIKSEMSGDLEDALLAVGECPAFTLALQSNEIISDAVPCPGWLVP